MVLLKLITALQQRRTWTGAASNDGFAFTGKRDLPQFNF